MDQKNAEYGHFSRSVPIPFDVYKRETSKMKVGIGDQSFSTYG